MEKTVESKIFKLECPGLAAELHLENYSKNCGGKDMSPLLSWEGEPDGTLSFAIVMTDIDAFGSGTGFDHWLVIDIPPYIHSLPKDAGNISQANLPAGARQTPYGGINYHPEISASHFRRYAGVCPPLGKVNRYEICIYALSVAELNVGDMEAPEAVKAAMLRSCISSSKILLRAGR